MTQNAQTTIPPYQPKDQRDWAVARWNDEPYTYYIPRAMESGINDFAIATKVEVTVNMSSVASCLSHMMLS